MKTSQQIPSSEYRKLSDEELIYRYAHRNENIAVNYLFERYGHLVFGICMKYINQPKTAKRTTEEIFIKLLDDLKRFYIDEFKPWLFKMVNNYCRMQSQNEVTIINNTIASTDINIENEIEKHGDYTPELLNMAIKQLEIVQRNCIELFYIEKMNYAAISQKTTYTPQQVKSLIQKGKQNLKLKLDSFNYVRR
ncbi:MAG TPA: sigma-70 family RNA polymerase sigma factor [Flavipsychrobacter sp.]|nr:sigma-70 family RNA polymerase sigma factor [Flavipsychrobacter sp.]